MLLRYAIGSALRRIRLDRELTLRTVADSARISMPYLSEIERGRKEPSSEVLGSVAEALGLDLVDIVQRVGWLLGERREAERREAERRELLRVERSFAFRAGELAPFDVDSQHALAALPDPAFGNAATNAYLLAA